VAHLVCAIGDLLLDVIVRLDGPIQPDTDTYGRTRVGVGGQAANVAAWAAALGGRGRVIAKRGRDAAGRIAADELAARGVDVRGPEVDGCTGTVVSLATPDGRRSMLTDRGVAPSLSPRDLEPEWLDGCDWLHVPGYSLVRSPIAEAALAASALAPHVSLDVSSTTAISELGAAAFRERVRELRPELVFATEEEAELVGAEAPTLVVKLGARGCRVDGDLHAALPAAVVDTTGAGDAFAAGFLLGGPELALRAAARCVATMGAMP
jgi:sugar/nucleoside kinase (ribokinase family)